MYGQTENTTETWEVCKGLNINLWYPPINDPSGKGVWLNTPTRSIRLSMIGQGMADILYAEKLQRLIDAGQGTSQQRAAAQAALDSVGDIVKTPFNGYQGYYNEFVTHDYAAIDTWKREVAGHIQTLSAEEEEEELVVHFRRLASVPGSMTLMLLDSDYTYAAWHTLADLQDHTVSGGGAVSFTYATKTVTINDKSVNSGTTPFKYIALVSVDKVGVVWELPEAVTGAKTIRFGTITTSK